MQPCRSVGCLLLLLLFQVWGQKPLKMMSDIEDYEEGYDYKDDQTKNASLPPTTSYVNSNEADSDSRHGFLKLSRGLVNVSRVSGESVRLRCEANGDPLPIRFRWFKNEAPVIEEKGRVIIRRYGNDEVHGSRLRIIRLDTHDTGYYKCEAYNAHHSLHSTAILLVRMSKWDRDAPANDPSFPSIFSNFPNLGSSQPVFEGQEGIHGFCQLYKGKACARVIGNRTIHVTSAVAQGTIEDKLIAAFSAIATSGDLSRRCADYAIPSLCYHAFPLCDDSTGLPKPTLLCHDECQRLENDICKVEYAMAQKHPIFGQKHLLPNCDDLPTRGSSSSENSDCLRLGIYQLDQTTTVAQHTCYVGNGADYRGSTSLSASGRQCQQWSLQIDGKSLDSPEHINRHNYCRNPGGVETQPWCFTIGERLMREHCDIPKCDDYLWLYILVPLVVLVLLSGLLLGTWYMIRRRKPCKSVVKTVVPCPGQQLELNNLLTKPVNQPRAIHFNSLRMVCDLGESSYGSIYKGELSEGTMVSSVIIKTLKPNVSPKTRQDFKREMDLMVDLHHPNLICLIGACLTAEHTCMVFEYLTKGDLHEFLLRHSPRSDVSAKTEEGVACMLGFGDFLKIASQIASGMEYLASCNLVHRDLATRNCLVGENLTIKIADFGTSKDVHSSDYYHIQAKFLPVRWMAPEAILYGRYTTDSDAWSYGVVLWEIFTYGLQPYFGYTNQEVIDMVCCRHLLPCPEDCPPYIYSLMLDCWQEIPTRRVTFHDLQLQLRSILNGGELPQCGAVSNTNSTVAPSSNNSDSIQASQILSFHGASQFCSNPPPTAKALGRPLPNPPIRLVSQSFTLPSGHRPATPPQLPAIIRSSELPPSLYATFNSKDYSQQWSPSS